MGVWVGGYVGVWVHLWVCGWVWYKYLLECCLSAALLRVFITHTPEDIDPSVGKFRNMVQTTIVPTKVSGSCISPVSCHD